MLEVSQKFAEKSRLMEDRVLVDPKVGNIPIRISNFGKEPQTIYENTETAVYEPVAVVKSQCSDSSFSESSVVTEHLQELYDRSSQNLKEDQKLN
ncbi:hypothetical protein DPMN_105870 [Dreissena polymorpha]|uniref:Uncharacterized protein n=1 Tax=Dreissena polymorpha TaxID=45954 RepID=A0A9D4K3Y7_DREPO|nr:hypothetical protein DPMN_105870 [Dreissena polymorpha]